MTKTAGESGPAAATGVEPGVTRDEAAVTSDEAAGRRAGGTPRTRLFEWVRAGRRAYVQVLGIPDYERYTAHMAANHPGDKLLSQREFFAWSIDRKYNRSGPRCC